MKKRIFLDLRNFDADRTTIRRLVKQLQKSPEFEKASGRVLFFKFDPLGLAYFYEAIDKALRALNYKSEIVEAFESELE